MDYEEFVITLKSRATGETLIEARYGGAVAESEQPTALFLDTATPLITALRSGTIDADAAKTVGGALFGVLFQPVMDRVYRAATTHSQSQSKRLRLKLDVRDPALVAIPWEYLYDPTEDRFIALHPSTSVVRAQSGAGIVPTPTPVTGELRLLLVISTPSDADPLNIDAELEAFEEMEEKANLSVERIPATFEALQTALRDPYHILHFTGHGIFAEGQGYLLFTNKDGVSERRTGEDLGVLLSGQSTLQLVVLSACEGSVTASGAAFAGVAQKLMQQDLPTVLAMQAPIADTDALRFHHTFYAALGAGFNLDHAVGEGRKAIRQQSAAWGVPTLYSQNPTPFTLTPSTPLQQAEKLWRKYQRVGSHAPSPVRQRLLDKILELVPTHPAATDARNKLAEELEAETQLAAGKAAYAAEQWEVAFKAFQKVSVLNPKLREVVDYLAELRGKLADKAPTPAQVSEYQPVLNALLEGKLVPFLGWDAALYGRMPEMGWAEGHFMPSASEVAHHLAELYNYDRTDSLLELSQRIALLENATDLYNHLATLLNADYPPTALHRLLAAVPQLLHAKGYPRTPKRRFVVLSAAFDTMMERAFEEIGQPYHLFAYRPGQLTDSHTVPPRFVHTPPGGTPREVTDPTKDGEILKDQAPSSESEIPVPILIKLCGAGLADAEPSAMVTEDHYLQYPTQPLNELLPSTVLVAIRPGALLFMGYNLQAWHLRLLWHRIRFGNVKIHSRAWAIHPEADWMAQRYWQENSVTVLSPSLESIVATISRYLNDLEPNPRRGAR